MKTITSNELKDILLVEGDRPQPISFIAIVDALARKTGNVLPGRLLKISRYRAWIGDYGRSVTKRLAAEGVLKAPKKNSKGFY